ncbi:GMC family oxidoreductase [Curvibacter lanceolatus]|uniref:GMC family oxidoreductase n=1 Tax=Curvibacter lanceolatus TaxID=86182 RepID=UPI0003762080|nr:GMC family oxidoreductase N-terminal domain-containing protein [Curvibacter lanceolatus]
MAQTTPNTTSLQADYIVVGAGPAGSALATRLAEGDPAAQVLLIEAGPAKPSFLSVMPAGLALLVPSRNRHNYAYQTVPQAGLGGRTGYVPRGRGLGGSSLINAMIYVRGQREDYDGWAALGCPGWGWSDVLPFFRRSEANQRPGGLDEALHGRQGPLVVSDLASPSPVSQAFVAAAQACGLPANADFNGARQEGVGLYQVFQQGGRRLDASRAYRGRAPQPNLQVLAEVRVNRVCFEGRRATGVEVADRDGVRVLTARREVILSAGAIASPQLLCLSGIGPADELARLGIPLVADAPQVGQNLQDHLDYSLNLRLNGPGLFGWGPRGTLRSLAALPAFRQGRGFLTTNGAEAGGFVRSSPQLERPDLQLHFCVSNVDDHGRRKHLATGVALHVCALRPHSRGSVRLASANPADMPLIDPAFLSHPDDLPLLIQGVRLARRILRSPPFAGLGGRPIYGTLDDESDDALAALIRAQSDTIYHPVGTCRMGTDPASVLDPALRVRGVSGLRVADASIMPTLVSGNTQAPSAMIGERAADLILKGRA